MNSFNTRTRIRKWTQQNTTKTKKKKNYDNNKELLNKKGSKISMVVVKNAYVFFGFVICVAWRQATYLEVDVVVWLQFNLMSSLSLRYFDSFFSLLLWLKQKRVSPQLTDFFFMDFSQIVSINCTLKNWFLLVAEFASTELSAVVFLVRVSDGGTMFSLALFTLITFI